MKSSLNLAWLNGMEVQFILTPLQFLAVLIKDQVCDLIYKYRIIGVTVEVMPVDHRDPVNFLARE